MLTKLIIIAFLVAIIASLFSGMVFMLRDDSRSRRTVRALTIRIGLSLSLIAFIVLAVQCGWIQPHGLHP